jgi:hypothetical protein
LVLSLAEPEWLEDVFGIDPDGRNGATEWLIVAGYAMATSGCLMLARNKWRKRASP